jgi:hypothetical protein
MRQNCVRVREARYLREIRVGIRVPTDADFSASAFDDA